MSILGSVGQELESTRNHEQNTDTKNIDNKIKQTQNENDEKLRGKKNHYSIY